MSLLVPYVGADRREVAAYRDELKRRREALAEAQAREAQEAKASEALAALAEPTQLLRNRDFRSYSSPIQAKIIIRECARSYGLTYEDMMCIRRLKRFVAPRQMAMYLIKKLTGASWAHIGRLFAGRDHATIYWGYRQTEKRMSADPAFAARVGDVERKVLGGEP